MNKYHWAGHYGLIIGQAAGPGSILSYHNDRPAGNYLYSNPHVYLLICCVKTALKYPCSEPKQCHSEGTWVRIHNAEQQY